MGWGPPSLVRGRGGGSREGGARWIAFAFWGWGEVMLLYLLTFIIYSVSMIFVLYYKPPLGQPINWMNK